MTLPPKGRSGRPGRPAASDKARSNRATSPRRPDDKSAPRTAEERKGAPIKGKLSPRPASRTADGERPARDDRAPRGDRFADRRDERAPRGDRFADRRDERAPRGDRFADRRDERAPRGDRFADRRDERAPRGDRFADRRDERAPRGDRFADRRDERAPRGDRFADRRDERGPRTERPARDERDGKPFAKKPFAGKPYEGRGKPGPRTENTAPDERPRRGPLRADGRPSGSASVQALSRPVAKPYAKPFGKSAPKVPAQPRDDSADAGEREGERIAKLLARAGVASRREVERLIAEGRVRLDGVLIETPATILKNLRGVSVDGKLIAAAAPTRIFRFHKPAGLITAERDPAGRPTIYNALRNALPGDTPRVMPVGRLDLNTEGLLLLTNDGELKRALELPATGIPRTYRARTFGDISQGQLEDLIEGIEIDGVRYGNIDANMERRTGRNQWIEMTLTEGKNREVRRVLEHLGLQVSRLLRTAYGPFELADLPRGGAEEVPQVLVERFRKSLASQPAPKKPTTEG